MSTRADVDTSTSFTPVRGIQQEIEHTASRRSGPRKWLRAVQWLIGAGLHPKANATTLRVAEDLAERMDYTTGHARYCMLDIAGRLGVDKATVKRHIKYLRELGALAWVQHGTLTNVRPLRDLPGYAATATVYAAVIPAAYDHAMGHTIVGSGYTARIVIDQRRQTRNPVDTAGNSPVENPASEGLAPPSLTWLRKESQVQVEGGSNYTSQARPPKTRIPRQTSLINGRRRTATDVKNAGNETRLVRALVNWTQQVALRELEFVLRPWTDRGWDGMRIADELNGMCAGVRWRPKNPVAFIRARIAQDTAHQKDLAQAVAWEDSTAAKNLRSLAALFGPTTAEPEPERTDEDRRRARLYGWNDWQEVADHLAEDQDDAIDLYGEDICKFAIGQQARLEHQGAWT
ncbi:cell wall protein [Streptomyces sp. AS02]|uniref:cell wall protein n=1 Tax=Streptomyces sp. AS02 TaxID=2938946 RepID=UPI0020215E8F|nr:cell wall protein [Streptomyces sp. AS02]MCL8016938.1 cell wall protein [Streptomyces sp. AS02]